MKKTVVLVFSLSLLSFMLPEKKKLKMFLAGDSTISIKAVSYTHLDVYKRQGCWCIRHKRIFL